MFRQGLFSVVFVVLCLVCVGCAGRYTGVPRDEKVAYFAEWRYDFSPPLYVDDRVMRTRFTPGAQFWFDLVTDTFIGGSKEIKDSTQVVNEKIATVRASERDVLTCVLESGRIVIIAKGQRLRHVRDGHLCDVFLQTEPKGWLP